MIRRHKISRFSITNFFPFLLLLIGVGGFYLSFVSPLVTISQLTRYFLFPAIYAGMMLLIFRKSIQADELWKTPLVLVAFMTSYVFLSFCIFFYFVWFLELWTLLAWMPLVLLIYFSLRYAKMVDLVFLQMLVALIQPPLIFLGVFAFGCGFRLDWIAWTPFWRMVMTGPCF